MSSKNDDSSAAGMAVALVAAVLVAMAVFVFAVLAFVTFVLTILCLFAWNTPRRIGGQVIQPEEARGFVGRGVVGAFMLPAFFVFVELVLGVQIAWQYANYIFIAGYIGGSLGIEILMAQQDGGGAEEIEILPPQLPVLPPRTLPRPQPEPFRYATWDDEEERSR